jgi:nitrite reductase/ring-hydroxylating ferredoxin subunit
MSNDLQSNGPRASTCQECPAAMATRRAFLRDVGRAVIGALALTAMSESAVALAESVVETAPRRVRGLLRTYTMPSVDSVSVDIDNEVILARWQGRIYAFSLRCPHRGSKLVGGPCEGRVFCPKHMARFRPDGSHDSGRQSRDLDRYDLRRSGGSVVVDIDALRRADQEPEAWRAAVITVA